MYHTAYYRFKSWCNSGLGATNRLGTIKVADRQSLRASSTPHRPLPPQIDDAELVQQVMTGQTEAFGVLIEEYQDRVFNTCWRICGNVEDARDLTQEAFLKAYEKLDTFKQRSSFYTWIFRIAMNLALSHRRSAAVRRFVATSQTGDVIGTQADGLLGLRSHKEELDESSPLNRSALAETHAALLRAMHDLDDDHRAVVVLRDIEGFDYQQIAEVLSIPSGTVKSRLHRARIALRLAVFPETDDSVNVSENG